MKNDASKEFGITSVSLQDGGVLDGAMLAQDWLTN